MRPLPCLWFCLLWLPACGGGGGGSGPTPSLSLLQLQVPDTVVAAGTTGTVVEVALASVPPGAVLLQFDVVIDPQRLGPSTSRAPLEPLQSQPTLDGDQVGPVFRVVFGDAQNRQPLQLNAGPLLRLHLETRPPRTPGNLTLRIDAIRAVDLNGNALAVDSAPVAANISIR